MDKYQFMDNLLEILRDPLWQSFGVVVSVIFGMLSIWFARASIPTKKLSIKFVKRIRYGYGPEYEVFTDGKTQQPGICFTYLLALENIGRIPIDKSDYLCSILLNIPSPHTVFSAIAMRNTPYDVEGRALIVKDGVEITPSLLNPGEKLEVWIDSVLPVEKPKLQGRFRGVKVIFRKEWPPLKTKIVLLSLTLFWSALLIYTLNAGHQLSSLTKAAIIFIASGLTAITFIASYRWLQKYQ